MISDNFKRKVIDALQEARDNYGGTDGAFAKRFSLNGSTWNQLKQGKTEGLIRETRWISLARELDIPIAGRKWNMAETDVVKVIREDVEFCQEFSKSRMYVDECGIGKTYTAKYLGRTMKNCFYIDASQCKTKQLFIRHIAKTVGADHDGRYADVKEDLKYYIKLLDKPVIIVDEAGDLQYEAFLELKELWNATENSCGWYLIGADGLQAKIAKGIRNKKVGYREIFSRYSEQYSRTVPQDPNDRLLFYRKLISDVLTANMENTEELPVIVNQCLKNSTGNIGGLRRAESLVILNKQ